MPEFMQDKEAEKVIYDRLRDYFSTRERLYTKGVFHVSDLLNPKQAYYKYTDPKPLSEREIGFFVAGLAHHFVVESAVTKTDAPVETPINWSPCDGITIVGRPDIRDYVFFQGEPNEFKTSRKWTIPEDPEGNYVDQLGCYCALANCPTGRISVFYICPGRSWRGDSSTTPAVVVWKLKFSDAEIVGIKQRLADTANKLEQAIEEKKPEVLPSCTSWFCGSKNKGKTSVNCKWYHECQPAGRYPEKLLGD